MPARPAPSSGQDPGVKKAPLSSSSLRDRMGKRTNRTQPQSSGFFSTARIVRSEKRQAVVVLCRICPKIVLCQSESPLMQESSCYCDSPSHSRSGRTISAQPCLLILSQSFPSMYTRTNTQAHTRVRELLLQSNRGDKERLVAHVCVCERGGRGVICPFQFAYLTSHGKLCKEKDLLST